MAVALLCLTILGVALAEPLLIADEVSYLFQAMAMYHGHEQIDLVNYISAETAYYPVHEYPPGTAFLLLPVLFVGGLKGSLVFGLICLVAGFFLLRTCLLFLGLDPIFALLVLIYPACQVLGHTVMSDLPSFAVICLFLLVFFKAARNPTMSLWFFAGLVGALSAIIRETNIIIPVVILIVYFLRYKTYRLATLAGIILGMAIYSLLIWWFYGVPWFLRDTGYDWSLAAVWINLPLYTAALTILLPGGLYFLWRSKSRYHREIFYATVIYALVYVFYAYNGFASSGIIKGSILSTRFMIPVLPLVIIAVASGLTGASDIVAVRYKRAIPIAAVGITVLVQSFVAYYKYEHRRITEHIRSVSAMGMHVIPFSAEVIKHVNPRNTEKLHLYDGDMYEPDSLIAVADTLYFTKLYRSGERKGALASTEARSDHLVKTTELFDGTYVLTRRKTRN